MDEEQPGRVRLRPSASTRGKQVSSERKGLSVAQSWRGLYWNFGDDCQTDPPLRGARWQILPKGPETGS